MNWTRLSCHGFAENPVRLQLFALAHNLWNLLRRLALLPSTGHGSLRILQVRLTKIGAKVACHAKYTCPQLAETSVPSQLVLAVLTKIRLLLEPVPR